MKKLVKKIVLFIVPILSIFVVFELFYKFIPNDYSYKYEITPQKFEDTEVLIFGNSHTFYGLNPTNFSQPTYSLAFVSQSLYFDQLLFDKYIDSFKKLKYIVLHIEYTSLSERIDNDDSLWRRYYYQYYLKLDIPTISKFDGTKYFLSSTRNFNTNIKILKRYFSESSIVDCDSNGFGINYTKDKKAPLVKEVAIQRAAAVEDHLMDFSENITRVQSIIDKCKSKNIQVVLLTMPVSNYFSGAVDAVKLVKIQKSCLDFKQNNSNVSYLNLFTDTRFTNDDFFDADHLHTDGARKASLIVNEFIRTH
jgi:hypothetical protein